MRKWRLGKMNCPRSRARDGRTWIETCLSEPSSAALSVSLLPLSKEQCGFLDCGPQRGVQGTVFLAWAGKEGPCPGGLFFIGNQLPHNFKGASFFANCRALSHWKLWNRFFVTTQFYVSFSSDSCFSWDPDLLSHLNNNDSEKPTGQGAQKSKGHL